MCLEFAIRNRKFCEKLTTFCPSCPELHCQQSLIKRDPGSCHAWFSKGLGVLPEFSDFPLSSPQVKSGWMGAVSYPLSRETGFHFHIAGALMEEGWGKDIWLVQISDFWASGKSQSALGKNQWIALNWLPLLYAQVQTLSCRTRKSDLTCAYHFYLMFLLWTHVQCSQSLSVFGYLTGKTKNISKFKTMTYTKTVCEIFKLVVFCPFKFFLILFFIVTETNINLCVTSLHLQADISLACLITFHWPPLEVSHRAGICQPKVEKKPL